MKEANNIQKIKLESYITCLEAIKSKLEFQKRDKIQTVKSRFLKAEERAHACGKLDQICDTLDMLDWYKLRIDKLINPSN